ncbi:MAG: rRNA synthase [Patescibacteria group bacterium]|jgi:pseudouridine synthase|nr:rRNA synthase [Patescibacteria group bacterium]
MEAKKTRINKELVELGLAQSRRKADEIVEAGLVTINGKIASAGDLTSKTDQIQISGRGGEYRSDITLLFNKPKGYICSHTQQGDVPTIFSILPKKFQTLKIAGRLDKDSQGLVILSSDGELINRLSHPSSGKLKTYVVDINKPMMPNDKKRLSTGVILPDGISTFINLKTITRQKLRFSLTEGRNRQIRRTLSQLGYKVTKLERISLGDFQLQSIPAGKYKFVDTKAEAK